MLHGDESTRLPVPRSSEDEGGDSKQTGGVLAMAAPMGKDWRAALCPPCPQSSRSALLHPSRALGGDDVRRGPVLVPGSFLSPLRLWDSALLSGSVPPAPPPAGRGCFCCTGRMGPGVVPSFWLLNDAENPSACLLRHVQALPSGIFQSWLRRVQFWRTLL